jgi:hypothetical protein
VNERLQEFARQAGFYASPEVEKFEKFAELIVKECMRVGRTSQINNGLVDTDIKEHFGLE